jgi:putative membrane protein
MSAIKKSSILSKESIIVMVLVIFYSVGIVGLLLPSTHDSFLPLSFFNLLLSFTLLILARKKSLLLLLLFSLVCIFYGYFVELIGTKTALLFGHYSYGANLGTKIEGVPLVIGVNWAILVITSSSLTNMIRVNQWTKIILAAALMTLLDFLIEPVAIKSDFWHWKNGAIPIYNYVCWFLVSLPIIAVYFKLNLAETNKVNNSLFVLLIVFFALLLNV